MPSPFHRRCCISIVLVCGVALIMPAVASSAATVGLAEGNCGSYAGTCVAVVGDAAANVVTVAGFVPNADGGYRDSDDGTYTTTVRDETTLQPGPGCTAIDGETVRCVHTLPWIAVDLGAGDDAFRVAPEAADRWGALRITGGPGNDRVDTGDVVAQLDAAVFGADGSSVIGGAGNDELRGGPTGEGLDGGPGDDTLHGGAGADTLSGRSGSDRILGEEGETS